MKRNPYLTPAMERVLKIMRDDEDDLVQEGRECWVGDHRTSSAVVKRLLQFCLIRPDGQNRGDGKFWRYTITSCGTRCLGDKNYTPMIVSELRKLRKLRR